MPYDHENEFHFNIAVRGNLVTVADINNTINLNSSEQCQYALSQIPGGTEPISVFLNSETLLPFDREALRGFIAHAGEHLPSENALNITLIFAALPAARPPETILATVAEMQKLSERGLFHYDPSAPAIAYARSGFSKYVHDYTNEIYTLRAENNAKLYAEAV